MKNSIVYPVYRKYLNEKSFFKVISEKEWEEIQIVGKKCIEHRLTANIFPDKNFLYDLTFDYKENWVEIDEKEYERAKNTCKD